MSSVGNTSSRLAGLSKDSLGRQTRKDNIFNQAISGAAIDNQSNHMGFGRSTRSHHSNSMIVKGKGKKVAAMAIADTLLETPDPAD